MVITVTGVPTVEINLTFWDHQEVIGIDLSFVKVLSMLKQTSVPFWVF